MISIKCVIVGDEDVGKTSMLISHSTKKFRTQCIPIVYGDYTANIMVDNELYNLCLYDTAGHPKYDSKRPLSYKQTDVFLLCFSVVIPSSLDNIKKKWLEEIKPYCRSTNYILIGTQIDLRDDTATMEALDKNNQKPFDRSDGQKLAEYMGAYKYLECSALTQIGLNDVFVEVILAAFHFLKVFRNQNKPTKFISLQH